MRRHDDDRSPDPRASAALAAIDATLAGEPADPEFAALSELALILRDERPECEPSFAAGLDDRVARRFASPGRPSAATAAPGRSRGRWPRWVLAPGAALAAGLVVAVLVVAGNGPGGPSPAQDLSLVSSSASAAASAPAARLGAPSIARSLNPDSKAFGATHATPSSGAGTAASAAGAASSSSATSATPATPVPTPPNPTGQRQIVQSAQLALQAPPKQIDAVAQRVFDVVGTTGGYVNSSSVTATGTPDGSATFQLSVPSAKLAAALTALSQLPGTTVLSRTDATTDITGQVGGAGMRLAEARALRTSLLKQLAAATTSEQVDSLRTQIQDADASIASDLSTLNGLKNKVAYSQISLTISTATGGGVGSGSGTGGGFTLHSAVHDAGRVLVVAAGVALIALAVLLPVGLVVALLGWIGLAVRRRRREAALDLI